MCLMAPGRVLARDDETCEVETLGRVDQASLFLTPEVEVGDWVLVTGGTVVRRLDPEQAAEMTRAFELLVGPAPEDAAEAAPGTLVST